MCIRDSLVDLVDLGWKFAGLDAGCAGPRNGICAIACGAGDRGPPVRVTALGPRGDAKRTAGPD
eukprot:6957540-Lingulodinium_polyedra.AAC.1